MASPIPLQAVAHYPLPGTAVPTKARFRPGSNTVTMLESLDGSLNRVLTGVDLSTGKRDVLFAAAQTESNEAALSPEEKLRRERQRERGLGVTSYAWSRDGKAAIVPLAGDLWVIEPDTGRRERLVAGDRAPVIDPQFSPDGTFVAYVQDDELHVVPTSGGTPRLLTSGARKRGVTHGLAEYIAQEEMDRHTGFWWSKDGTALAYTEVDERHIPTYRIVDQGSDTLKYEDHRYPFAGGPNAKVRLGVVAREGGGTTWMDLEMDLGMQRADDADFYLARVHWLHDGALVAEIENRAQTELSLVRYDVRTGRGTVLLTERSDVWINLHGMFESLEAGGFLWGSERDGFRHLYVHDDDGKLVRRLTQGDWMVDEVIHVDERDGFVYFTGTKDSPIERHLYRVPLAGGEVERLTAEPGMHDVEIDDAGRVFVDVASSPEAPPTVSVTDIATRQVLRSVPVAEDPRIEAYALGTPELVTLTNRHGTVLHGAVYRPPSGDGPFPTLVSVYGGPHAQRVTKSWDLTADLRAQRLAQLGYLVFKLDNRGSARRGLAFEGAIKGDLGHLELEDQVDGVRWLVERGLADPERVGIYGWSYGGYLSAMALVREGETFKAAVAGAPVTHWDGYDTHYTERYMGHPEENADGYRRSSVMAHVDKLQGALLLVHGLMDENVHFRHTARLIDALAGAGKDHAQLIFPSARHMARREPDRVLMEQRIADFFATHLRAPTTPVP